MSEPQDVPEYFEYDQKSYRVAKAAMCKMLTMNRTLEYLLESKPRFLNPQDSMLGIDKQQLEKQVHGIADKMTIHCYPERGDRLIYLYDILSKKLSKNDDYFKMIIRFLLEMSERPTSQIQLRIKDTKYSELQDDDMADDEKVVSEKELLKLILGEISEAGDNITISYSSDSELSDWSGDEDSEKSKPSSNEVTALVSNIKISHSFSDFTSIKQLTDEESRRQEMVEYWNSECTAAKKLWTDKASRSSVMPLQGQPVITGLLALHSKFGEYWEWKRVADNHLQRMIIQEEVLIREILWQFSILKAESSQLFKSDWNLKPGLMTSSLCCKSFGSFMLPIQNALRSLCILKNFVQQVYQNSKATIGSKPFTPPILLSYAHGLNDILNFISETTEKIELAIRKNQGFEEPSATVIQLKSQIQPYIDCIVMLHSLHTSIFQPLHEFSVLSSDKDAVLCIELLYSQFTTLNLQRSPMKFGFVQYLFSQCMRAFLGELNSSLTLNWTEHLLFNRFPEVKISHHNFWTECIKRRDFDDVSNQETIFAIPFFCVLVDEVMIVLKTSEMIRQLEEDCVKIIGHPPDPKEIVDDYLKIMFPSNQEDFSVPEFPNLEPDYQKHFRFLGFENSLEADSVKQILNKFESTTIGSSNMLVKSMSASNYKWLFNRSTNQVPEVNSWYSLETTLRKWYNPLISKASHCIHKIFEDYSVDQSLQLFREIILETREDFAQSVITLVSTSTDIKSKSSHYTWKTESSHNSAFQKLLADCYPEGRETFDIELKLDNTFDTNYRFVVKPHFPLNLVLFEDSIDRYMFVARQLSRIRKSLWEINALSIKDFKAIGGVDPNRMLLFRFAFLHFCSSLRAYLVLKMFVKDASLCTHDNLSHDIDLIRQVHGGHLKTIEIDLLRHPVMEKVILRKMCEMSEILRKVWHAGISLHIMVLLEDTLKKCWSAILSFRRNNNEFNELAYHFGPIPSCL